MPQSRSPPRGELEKKAACSPCCGDETATYYDRAFFFKGLPFPLDEASAFLEYFRMPSAQRYPKAPTVPWDYSRPLCGKLPAPTQTGSRRPSAAGSVHHAVFRLLPMTVPPCCVWSGTVRYCNPWGLVWTRPPSGSSLWPPLRFS